MTGLVGGARTDGRRPGRDGNRTRVAVDGLIGTLDKARRIVDRRHVDDEGLRGAGIYATIGGAAAVLEVKRDRCRTVGVRCRGVGEHAGGRHGGTGTEQCGVAVAGNLEGQRLRTVAGWPRRDARGPGCDRLRTGVFKHRLIGTFSETRRLIDGGHCDDESLVGAGVETAVGDAAVVLQVDGDGGRAGLIGRWGEGERAGWADRRTCAEHRSVGVADDLEGNGLCGLVCAATGADAGCPVGNGLRRGVL